MATSNRPTSAPTAASAFNSYIGADTQLAEFTPRAVVVGTLLGMVFGMSSLYLVLKVGLTVSASIPVAVISIAMFRMWSRMGGRDATILEHNIAQTAGSAGESIAFGVGVTMPAILILGFDLEFTRVTLVSVLGGLLGILMMIPLRHALMVEEHATLKYPEGTACAEVLKAAASPESRAAASPAAKAEAEASAAAGLGRDMKAHIIFTGFGLGLAYKTLMVAFKAWKDIPQRILGAPLKGGSVGIEISPELLGVGYIIGPKVASIMCGGGVLAYLVLIPMIRFFGDAVEGVVAPGTLPIREMDPDQVRGAYILYIGAGAVAAGGLVSLLRSLPTIWRGLRGGLGRLQFGSGASRVALGRTERDLSPKWVACGMVLLLAGIALSRPLHMNLLGAFLILVFGFLFVTVSSRLTGEIGSSSNPISGMTVATLLLTCLVFLTLGWVGGAYYVTALSVGAIVCIASSNGGTTSQDLKTGFLVGATPSLQQVAILIGTLASALILGPVLLGLNDAKTVYVPAGQVASNLVVRLPDSQVSGRARLAGIQARSDTNLYWMYHQPDATGGSARQFLLDDSGRAVWYVDAGINGTHTTLADGTRVEKFSAPKAVLMSYIIKGILDRRLPWGLVLLGVMIALTLEFCGVSSLAFAVGVYLPLSSSSPIFVGGLIRWLVDARQRRLLAHAKLDEARLMAESDRSPGVLLSSGYIAGGAIAGIVIAFMSAVLVTQSRAIDQWSQAHNPFYSTEAWNLVETGWGRADALALIPFLLLGGYLYAVARPRKPVSIDS